MEISSESLVGIIAAVGAASTGLTIAILKLVLPRLKSEEHKNVCPITQKEVIIRGVFTTTPPDLAATLARHEEMLKAHEQELKDQLKMQNEHYEEILKSFGELKVLIAELK